MNFKSYGGEVKEELEYRSTMRICRENPLLTCFRNEIIPLHRNFTLFHLNYANMWKTHRKWTGTELIGKVGEKLEGKGTQAIGGIIIFDVKYSAGCRGLVCQLVDTWNRKHGEPNKKPWELNGGKEFTILENSSYNRYRITTLL